jgi:hypothetical protein
MLHRQLFLPCAAALLAASAWAGTIHDPAAGVESDNFSSALSTFTGVIDPHANGGVLGLYNDTGYLITSLSLHMMINTGLTPDDIGSSFTCNSGSANPFFKFCGFDYISETGSLTVNFFGVDPPDDDENGGDAEIGEQEGIPPVVGACLLNPDSERCNLVGHFAFVFNNNFLTSGEVFNGWVADATSVANPETRLFTGTPLFDAPQYTLATPEPGSLVLLGCGILALACLSLRVKTPKVGGKSHTRTVQVGWAGVRA